MNNSRLVKRVVTCQGSIQLVTALSVINYREREQKLGTRYENYLIIYDLNSPPGQIDAFAAFIEKMAQLICDWKKILYIPREQMKSLADDSKTSRASTYFARIHQLVGTDSTDEIYLSRNWQFGNQLFINAYRSAQKICYGDSIGIYFGSDSQAFFLPQNQLKQWLKKIVTHTRSTLGSAAMQTINFDRGYFILPEILGEQPPMPVTVTDSAGLLKTFGQLRCLIDRDYIAEIQQQIKGKTVSILLTSNFSEAGRMSLQQEIEAYRKFLLEVGVSDRSVLIIKPHPRDSSQKMAALKDAFKKLFTQIIVLSDTSLFFLPFEAFFTAAFLDESYELTYKVRVYAFSSACLSLKLLFDVPSYIGFGHTITDSFFDRDHAPGRIKHEQDLRMALTRI